MPYEVKVLSFFFVMMPLKAIQETGFFDETLPGGDDVDYCIRLRDLNYKLAVNPSVFVWHHYGQTGKNIYGEYWDSEEHTEKIKKALIDKHGFEKYVNMLY